MLPVPTVDWACNVAERTIEHSVTKAKRLRHSQRAEFEFSIVHLSSLDRSFRNGSKAMNFALLA
jgi:hypothetical protein